MKRKMIYLVFFLVFFSIAFIAFALTLNEITPEDIFIKLLYSKSDLATGIAIFEIKNPTTSNIAISNSNFKIYFNENTTKTNNINIYINASINVTDYFESCKNISINATSNSTDCRWIEINKTIEGWIPLKAGLISLLPNEIRKVKIEATWHPMLGYQVRDWIPQVNIDGKILERKDWQWWSSNWTYKSNISIQNLNTTTTFYNYQVKMSINLSSLVDAGKLQGNCEDLRFINSTGTELNYWIYNCTNSGTLGTNATVYVNVTVLPNNAITIIEMYYGNSTVGNTTARNGTKVFEFFDDFNRANSDTVGNGWTETNAAGAYIQNNALYQNTTSETDGWDSTYHSIAITTGWGQRYESDMWQESACQNYTAFYNHYFAQVSNKRFGYTIYKSDAPLILPRGDNYTAYLSGGAWTKIATNSTKIGYTYTLQMDYFQPPTTLNYTINNTLVKSAATGTTSAITNRIVIGSEGSREPTATKSICFLYVDNVRVSNLNRREPNYTVGIEETATLPPSNNKANLTDNLSFIDTIIYNISFIRKISDNITIIDFITLNKNLTKQLSDNITFLEILKRNASFSRYTSDNLSIYDSIGIILGKIKMLSDSINITDALIRNISLTRSLSDNITLLDNLKRNISLTRIGSDNITILDAINIIKGKGIYYSDNITLLDTIKVNSSLSRKISDNINISEGLKRNISLTRTLSNIINITDNILSQQGVLKKLQDDISLLDSVYRNISITRYISENITISEGLKINQSLKRALSDNITFAEGIESNIITTRIIIENLSIIDNIRFNLSSIRYLSDIINISEYLNATNATKIIGGIANFTNMSESITILDGIKINISLIRKITDTITFSENLTVTNTTDIFAPTITITLIYRNITILGYNWSIFDYNGYNITIAWLEDNTTRTLIEYLPNNTLSSYNFSELSRNRNYVFWINATDGKGNSGLAYLIGQTLQDTGIISKWLIIGFLGLVVILLYYYFFHDVIYFGVLAGIIMIFLAIVLGATGSLSDLSCVSNNIRETIVGNTTSHDYHIICQEPVLDMNRDFINVLSLILLVIGSFMMVDFWFAVRKHE